MSDSDDGAFSVLPALRAMGEAYRFCSRCWMPLAPVRRCRCAPEPYPDGATPARVLAEHPELRELAARVQRGDYAADTATWEQQSLGFWRWLFEHRHVGEHVVWTYEVVDGADVCK